MDKYYKAYQWLLEAEEGVWFDVNKDQEKILLDIDRASNSPFMPELQFKENRVRLKRWDKIWKNKK